jgi:hypothetical protein
MSDDAKMMRVCANLLDQGYAVFRNVDRRSTEVSL